MVLSNWPSCLQVMQGSRDAVFMSCHPCWGGIFNDAGVFESPMSLQVTPQTAPAAGNSREFTKLHITALPSPSVHLPQEKSHNSIKISQLMCA